MSERITWKWDSQVMGLSMLTISPGFSGIGVETNGKAPNEVLRAAVETAILGVGAVLITKSWIPLFAPFAYLVFEYLWEQSSYARNIDAAVSEGSEQWQ